jgi:hypothetical protein
MNASALKYLLEVIGIASGVASGVLTGDAKKGALVSEALVAIVQKTLAAHEAVVGKPVDPKLLRPFEPL